MLTIIATLVGSILCLGLPFVAEDVRINFNCWWEEVKSGREVDFCRGLCAKAVAESVKENLQRWPNANNSAAGFLKMTVDGHEIKQKFIFRDTDGSQWSKADLLRAIDQMVIQSCANAPSTTDWTSLDIKNEYVVISKAQDGFRASPFSKSFRIRPTGFGSSGGNQTAGYTIASALNDIGFNVREVIVDGEFV